MSEIFVDTIKNKAGSTSLDSDKLPDMYSGSPKAWMTHGSTTVIKDSFNVSSLTDSATGKTAVNFSNAFDAKDYATSICSMRSSGSNSHYENNGVSGTATALHAVYISGTSAADTNMASVICVGELA